MGGTVEFDSVTQALGTRYCSLGSSIEYYRALSAYPKHLCDQFLTSMRDVVFDPAIYEAFESEAGFQKSLLRDVSQRDVRTSFPRALRGDADPTPYDFAYKFENDDGSDGQLNFFVEPQSRPPTNVHVLIGRNGVGKTRILAGIADNLTDNKATSIGLAGQLMFNGDVTSGANGEFLNLVIVSYSVFDRFDPITAIGERTDEAIPHYYVGIKGTSTDSFQLEKTSVVLKSQEEVRQEFRESFGNVLGDPNKRSRLSSALQTLESDPMLRDLNLSEVARQQRHDAVDLADEIFLTLSSGHKVVILTITRLVELVSDRSLVLIDEPETHLHPPLLGSFIRALSDLLQARNGVAVIATHSPVLLQEVPSSCVQVVSRSGKATVVGRPDIETFGENVGTLTRKVFELEVEDSGFYQMLVSSAGGRTYDEVLELFEGKIGGEGRAVVRAQTLRVQREESSSTE